MKHLSKVFAIAMLISSAMGFAQVTETVKETNDKKVEKVYKADSEKKLSAKEDAHANMAMKAEKKVAEMDANQDGKISLEEASKAENKKYHEYFSKIDTNADGFIDVTEMTAKMSKKKDKAKKEKMDN